MNNLIIQLQNNPFLAYAVTPSICKETGYTMKTTFYGDFLVCLESEFAIKDTFERAFRQWKDDKDYGTELSMVLNWLCWAFADYNDEIARLYQDLWRKVDGYIMDNWKGEKLSYYLSTTD